jgi:hypothetical protein
MAGDRDDTGFGLRGARQDLVRRITYAHNRLCFRPIDPLSHAFEVRFEILAAEPFKLDFHRRRDARLILEHGNEDEVRAERVGHGLCGA